MLETAKIDLIFVSTRGALVPDQIVVGQDSNGHPLQLNGLSVCVGMFEFDATDSRDDVDPPRCHADLKDDTRLGKIVLMDCAEWSTECRQLR